MEAPGSSRYGSRHRVAGIQSAHRSRARDYLAGIRGDGPDGAAARGRTGERKRQRRQWRQRGRRGGKEATSDFHLQRAALRVQKVLQESGESLDPGQRSHLSIGVLMRSNAKARVMMNELRRLGVPAALVGGEPISFDPAVGVCWPRCNWPTIPSEPPPPFEFSQFAVGRKAGAARGRGTELPNRGRCDATAVGGAGLCPHPGRLAETLAPGADHMGARRLLQLLELADAWERVPGGRPADFISSVQSTRWLSLRTFRFRS